MKSKSIAITGIQRAFPDSMAKDGACREIINARFRKGCWRPIQEKKVYKSWSLADYHKIYLHDIENSTVHGEPNMIAVKFTEQWYEDIVIGAEIVETINHPAYSEIYQIVDGVPVLIDAEILGDTPAQIIFLKQTMLAVTPVGVITYLWKDGKYNKLAMLPVPIVYIENQASRNCSGVYSDNIESLAGEYYKLVNNASEDGYLLGSILYVAAYRTFDGSYICHTIPKYLEIGSDAKLRNAGKFEWSPEFRANKLKVLIDLGIYDKIKLFEGIIDKVVIFSTKLTTSYNVDSAKYRLVQGFDRRTYTLDEFYNANEDFKKLTKQSGWYELASIDFTEFFEHNSDIYEKDADTKGFYQDYATRNTLTTDQFSHHKLAAKFGYVYNDRVHLLNIRTIFGDASVQNSDSVVVKNEAYLKASENDCVITVWLTTSTGDVIMNTPTKIGVYKKGDSYRSQNFDTFIAAENFLNSVKLSPNYITGSGKIVSSTRLSSTGKIPYYSVLYSSFTDNTEYYIIPAITGFNDARALKMRISIGNKYLALNKLERNDALNMALFSTPNYEDVVIKLSDIPGFPESVEISEKLSIHDTNRLQVSEIQNPFVFPAKNSYQVGTGDGLAIAAGSTPLSSGQFGQFPLQVFTTKGIWAMEVGTGDVLYTNIVPAGSEVVNNVQNIVPIPGGVCYTTDYGLFVVSGLKSVQLSEVIENDGSLINLYTLPEIVKLCSDSKFAASLSNALSDVDFNTYLQNSKIGYDHENKELIVTNSEHGYSYLYSIENQGWYKISKSYNSLINAYPKLYAVTNSNVRSISEEEESFADVLFITMSQAIDAPEVYKKIERLIFRCRYTTVADKYPGFYIFASNDQLTWQLIGGKQKTGAQINDLLCQRSHGSAKYYMFVFAGFILGDSELKQIDIVYDLKLGNKLR